MLGFIAQGVRGLAARIADWRQRQIARAELESLDDRTLADIGLRRGDIPLVVKGAAEHVEEAGRATGAASRPAANANAAPRRVA